MNIDWTCGQVQMDTRNGSAVQLVHAQDEAAVNVLHSACHMTGGTYARPAVKCGCAMQAANCTSHDRLHGKHLKEGSIIWKLIARNRVRGVVGGRVQVKALVKNAQATRTAFGSYVEALETSIGEHRPLTTRFSLLMSLPKIACANTLQEQNHCSQYSQLANSADYKSTTP